MQDGVTEKLRFSTLLENPTYGRSAVQQKCNQIAIDRLYKLNSLKKIGKKINLVKKKKISLPYSDRFWEPLTNILVLNGKYTLGLYDDRH